MDEHAAENDPRIAAVEALADRLFALQDTRVEAAVVAHEIREALSVIPPARAVTTPEHCPKCGGVFVHDAACPIPPGSTVRQEDD